MSGLLNKIPQYIKECFVICLCIISDVLISKQDHFEIVYESMDGVLTYLSIMSSVSFAILAVLMQQFDKNCCDKKGAMALENTTIKISQKMNVEIWRIVFILLPVLAYSMISFFDVRNIMIMRLMNISKSAWMRGIRMAKHFAWER